jgi:hypothetical protein
MDKIEAFNDDGKERIYIIQLCPILVSDEATHIHDSVVAIAAINIYLNVEGIMFEGTLSGYIARVNAYVNEYSGVSESHYVSITKCTANGCYFQTDDLDEDDPKNIIR